MNCEAHDGEAGGRRRVVREIAAGGCWPAGWRVAPKPGTFTEAGGRCTMGSRSGGTAVRRRLGED